MEVLKNLSMGAGLQFSSESLANASYLDFRPDASALLVFAPGWKLGLDYAFSGWGTWPGKNVSTLTAGLSWEKAFSPDIRVLAAFGGLFQSDQTDRLQGGVEVAYQSSLFARAGYEFEPNGEAPSVLSLGAGFVLAGLTLDYAYMPYGDVLGSTHRFSLSFPLSVPADQGLESKTTESSRGKPGFPATAVSPSPSGPVSEATLPGFAIISAGSLPGPAGNPESSASPSMASTLFSSAPQEGAAAGASPTPSSDNLVVQFSIPSDLGDQAKMMESQGHYPQALGLYLQALKQKPENYHLWWGLGHVYEKLGRRDYAVYCYKRVLQLDPDQKALADWLASYEQARPTP
jgi:tetratricopeptide (TPR) repeat protein